MPAGRGLAYRAMDGDSPSNGQDARGSGGLSEPVTGYHDASDDDDEVAVYREQQHAELLDDDMYADNLDNNDSDPWSPVPRTDAAMDHHHHHPLVQAQQALQSSGKTGGDVVTSEEVADDGSRTTHFANGTFKQVHVDGRVVVKFFNEDVKQTLSDGTVVYYYAEAGTTHTSKASGTEVGEADKQHALGWALALLNVRFVSPFV